MKYIGFGRLKAVCAVAVCAVVSMAMSIDAHATEVEDTTAIETEAVDVNSEEYEEQLRLYYEALEAQEEAAELEEIKANYTMTKQYTSTTHVSNMGYWLYRPTASTEEALPLIVYLHGSDGKGSDLDKVMNIEGIPNYIQNGDIYPNAIVIAPQCPSSQSWSSLTKDVMEVIAQVVMEQNVDVSRISLTGCSLGGIGTFRVAIENPDFFSAVVPVCGSVNPSQCSVLNGVDIKIFHGTLDYGMGFSVKTAAEVIEENGGSVELIMLEGEGHEIRHVYKDAEYDLINWMISQQRDISEIETSQEVTE